MRNFNGLKRIIAIGMLTVAAANFMTGCFYFYIPVQLPEEYNEETYPQGDLAAYVEKFAYGENVEYLGDGHFRSLDRDLEFEETWEIDAASEAFGIQGRTEREINSQFTLGGHETEFYNNYLTAVTYYWTDDILESLNSHNYRSVELVEPLRVYAPGDRVIDGKNTHFFTTYIVTIYIPRDASQELLDDVEQCLRDLRDICAREDEFHDRCFGMNFNVHIWFIDEDEGLMLGDGYFNICSAHTDEEINEHYYMYQGRSWDQASVLYINPVKEGYINIIV